MAEEKTFEIKKTASQVLLRVSADAEGAKPGLSDIQKALVAQGIVFQPEVLMGIWRRASNQLEPLVVQETTVFEVMVSLSPDHMQATLTLVPPQKGNDRLDPAKIKQAIKDAGITRGLLLEEIQRAVREKIYNRPVVIARGQPAQGSQEGSIEFLFAQEQTRDLSSSRMNLKEVRLISNVTTGQVIARITPPNEGSQGFTVKGDVLRATAGRRADYKLGANVYLSPDEKEVIASADGYVVLDGGKLAVEEMYRVEAVNATTGNIHFKGVVNVLAGVEDGFVVEGEKGIDVVGTVGKATLKSKGNVIIRGGIIGGAVETEGSVEAKFISEAVVRAGQNVTAEEYILHSTVEAGKMVRVVKPPDGFINGGHTRAGDVVWTPNLGSSNSEFITEVEVGVGPNLRQKLENTQVALERNKNIFDRQSKNLLVLQKQWMSKGALPTEHQHHFDQFVTQCQQARNDLFLHLAEYQELYAQVAGLSEEQQGIVFVVNNVFAGVNVSVRRRKVNVNNPLSACAFKILAGALKAQNYDEAFHVYRIQNGGKTPF